MPQQQHSAYMFVYLYALCFDMNHGSRQKGQCVNCKYCLRSTGRKEQADRAKKKKKHWLEWDKWNLKRLKCLTHKAQAHWWDENHILYFTSRPAANSYFCCCCCFCWQWSSAFIFAWPLHSVLLLTDSDYYRNETDKYFLHKLMNVQQWRTAHTYINEWYKIKNTCALITEWSPAQNERSDTQALTVDR